MKSPIVATFQGLGPLALVAPRNSFPAIRPCTGSGPARIPGSAIAGPDGHLRCKSATDATRHGLRPAKPGASLGTLPPGPPRCQTCTLPLTGSCHTTSGVLHVDRSTSARDRSPSYLLCGADCQLIPSRSANCIPNKVSQAPHPTRNLRLNLNRLPRAGVRGQ